MKKLKKIAEEIIPLSRQQNILVLLIIIFSFNFLFFAMPTLADEAVAASKSGTSSTETNVQSDNIVKDIQPDNQVLQIIREQAEKVAAQKAEEEKNKDKVIYSGIHVITAYNSEAAQTDDSPCITANGFNVCEHGEEDTIAANFLKFGTKVKIPELFGDRVFVVRDRMNKRYSDRVDVWMVKRQDAVKFGVKKVTIQVIE
jgi:3D (Asp-Asp-Asp) domain-containing protein